MDNDEGSRSKAVYERTRYDRQADENKEATRKRGRKDDGLIKGRSKSGPQEERGRVSESERRDERN